MEWFSADMWTALLLIILIDLVLAGDNAVVIGMAARNLPKEQQKKAIIWGTVGAVVIRALATIAVVWLLKIPGLMFVGGLFLIWIALKLLIENKGHDSIKAGVSLAAAIRTIVIADAVMGIDNVLAVAGAAHGDPILVIIGLAISVPIMVWGSTLIVRLLDRYPITVYIGAAILAFTAGKMVVSEAFVKNVIGTGVLYWAIVVAVVVVVVLGGQAINRVRARRAGGNEHEPSKAS